MRRILPGLLIALLASHASLAGQSGWTFDIDNRDQPGLKFVRDDKIVFYVGCGRAFAIHATYPGGSKPAGTKATLLLSSARQQIALKGEIDSPSEDDPADVTNFVQWDLGFRRQDPALFGAGWNKLKDRLFDLLDSRKPLTVSARGGSYRLPPVDAPRWKARFKEKC